MCHNHNISILPDFHIIHPFVYGHCSCVFMTVLLTTPDYFLGVWSPEDGFHCRGDGETPCPAERVSAENEK